MPRTQEQIERQIKALEYRLKEVDKNSASWFALLKKIANMKKELDEAKKFDFLAK